MNAPKLRLVAVAAAATLLASGCSLFGGAQGRTISADFSRGFQVFPGVKVDVLGVPIGRVSSVEPDGQIIHVTMDITDSTVKIPADAKATVLPESLLGERYVQIWPAYTGGEALQNKANIPIARTFVPTEGDEFLQAVNKYFGKLKGKTLSRFFGNAARVLDGRGKEINGLIHYGAGLIGTLSQKRDRLARMIQDFNTITQALSTRQKQIANLIGDYNTVGATISQVRSSIAGTIEGLNQASTALAALLISHRHPLEQDIASLTRTSRTLTRNVHSFATTGHYATRLFLAANRAINHKTDWLRLGNQGQEIGPHVMDDLTKLLLGHLTALCNRSGSQNCSSTRYWQLKLPGLFCRDSSCTVPSTKPGGSKTNRNQVRQSLKQAIRQLPDKLQKAVKSLKKDCSKAKHPKKCRDRKRKKKNDLEDVGGLIGGILNGTPLPTPSPSDLTGGLPGSGGGL